MSDVKTFTPRLVDIAPNAIEKLKSLKVEECDDSLKLRIFVTGGGCSGLQYGFSFDGSAVEDDTLISRDGVDVLIHEATFLEDTQDHATEHLHSTATGAVRTALACGAKHLVLTHFSARIKDGNVPLAEAKGIIGGSELDITLAHDGDRVLLHDNADVSHQIWSGKDWAV